MLSLKLSELNKSLLYQILPGRKLSACVLMSNHGSLRYGWGYISDHYLVEIIFEIFYKELKILKKTIIKTEYDNYKYMWKFYLPFKVHRVYMRRILLKTLMLN